MIVLDALPPRSLPAHLSLVMYSPLGPETARAVLQECRRAVLTTPGLAARLEELAGHPLPLDAAPPATLPGELLLVCAEGEELAFWRVQIR
jgi:hypothetical protein